jgi:hypothetical protein
MHLVHRIARERGMRRRLMHGLNQTSREPWLLRDSMQQTHRITPEGSLPGQLMHEMHPASREPTLARHSLPAVHRGRFASASPAPRFTGSTSIGT